MWAFAADTAAQTLPTLSISSPTVTEGRRGETAAMTFTVSLSAASAETVTVAYATDGANPGTATAGTDYTTLAPGTLTFAAGETSKTITVTVIGDGADEFHETIRVTLSNPTNAVLSSSRATGTGVITDDDGPPTVMLSVEPSSISENGGTATVSVTLEGVWTNLVRVRFSDVAGAWTVGSTTIDVPPGSTTGSRTVTITATDNARDEEDRAVTVTATAWAYVFASATAPALVRGAPLTITDDDAAPTVTLAAADGSISENGGSTTISATLSHASSQPTTITVESPAGAYSTGADATITIPAGSTTGGTDTVTITAVNNTRDEADRLVTVTGSASNPHGVGAVTGASITITDDDGAPTVTLSPSPSTVSEAGGTASVSATLAYAWGYDVTVTVGAVAGAWTVGSAATITIPAGSTTSAGRVTITAVDNRRHEAARRVTLTGTAIYLERLSGSPLPASRSAFVSGAALTITDDDRPAVTLALSSASIAESGASNSATVTASLDRASTVDTTVTVSATPGTNAAAGDFALSSRRALTIPAGSTTGAGTVTVTAVDNVIDEPDKSVTVWATAANGLGATPPRSMSLTITDDDPEPSLSVSSPTVLEGDLGSASLRYAVTLSAASGRRVTVSYADAGTGTATAGTDYTALASGTLTFAAGETSRTVSVSVAGDTDDEPNETVVLRLSGASGANIAAASGTGTITDDDGAPSFNVGAARVTEGDVGSVNLVFPVTLAPVNAAAVTVRYAEGTGGTATAGTDYTALAAGALTIAAGVGRGTITVSVTGDATDEPDETVVVTLSNASAGAAIGNATATGTIRDDDPAPTVTLAAADARVWENGGAATISASLSHASSEATTVTLTPLSGVYTVGTDATITIPAGATANAADTVTVTAVGNTTDAPDRVVIVPGAAANTQGIGVVTGARLTIRDDDAAPTVTLTAAAGSIPENGGATTISATLSHASSEGTTVTLTPRAGVYTVGSDAAITIAAGATANAADTVAVAAVDNRLDEADRVVTVTGSAANAHGIGAVTGARLTITDDEVAPAAGCGVAGVRVRVNVAPTVIGENGGRATITTTLLDTVPRTLYVYFTISGGTLDTDYTLSGAGSVGFNRFFARVVTFAAGSAANSAQSFTLSPTNDSATGNRTLAISGSSSTTDARGFTVDCSLPARSVTIVDDDSALVVSPVSGQATEAGGTSAFTVKLVSRPSAAVTMTVRSGDESEGTASPGSLTFAASTWNTAQTVTVTGVDDQVHDGTRSYSIRLGAPSSTDRSYSRLAHQDVPVSTTDDESRPTLSLSLSPSSVSEHGGVSTVSATLSHASAAATRITVIPPPGRAYAVGADGSITIPAGSTTSGSDTATVVAVDNDVDAADVGVPLAVRVENALEVTTAPTPALLIENDEAAPAVTLAVSPRAISENGGVGTITATLSHASGAATTITVSPVAGAYTVGADATITIPALSTADSSDTATITAVDNAAHQADRTVNLSAAAANRHRAGAVRGAVTLTDDDGAPTVWLAVSPAAISEARGRAAVSATLANAWTSDVTVVVDAREGAYAAGENSIVIAAGSTISADRVTLTALDNSRDESDRTVTVTGRASYGAGETRATTFVNGASLTITDDDEPGGLPDVFIRGSRTSELWAGTSGTFPIPFTVGLTAGAGPGGATVDYAVNTSRSSAAAGSDYRAGGDFASVTRGGRTTLGGTLTFREGETSKTVNLTGLADRTSEGVENVVVEIGNPAGARVAAGRASASATISDGALPALIAIDPASVTEGDSGRITLRYRIANAGSLVSPAPTVRYSDAGAGTATAGTDYSTVTSGTLTFSSLVQYVNVTVLGDTLDENDETILLELSDPTNAAFPDGAITISGTGTIRDDDPLPRLSVDSPSVAEGDRGRSSNLTFTVTLSPASGRRVTTSYRDVAGTANLLDYAEVRGTLTFEPGETSKTVSVPIRGDTTDEADETLSLLLSAHTGATATESSRTGTGTITDDDGEPSLSIDSPSVTEGDRGSADLTFTVTLDAASGKQVTVAYAEGAGGTGTAGADYTALSTGMLTFAAGETSKTVAVSVTGDTTDEPNETVVVALSSPTNATVSATAGSGTGTITDDDDAPTVTLALSRSSIPESGATNSATVTARLGHPSSQDTTITVSAAAGANTASGDFMLSAGPTLTIAAGATSSSGTVTVTAVDNSTDEADKSVTVSGSATNSQGITQPASVTLTITDDDDAPTVTLALSRTSIPESGATNRTTVTAKLDHPSIQPTTITVAAAPGTNTASGDFTLSAGPTLTIAAGATSSTGSVTVTAVDNSTDEADKSVTVSGTATNGQGITQPSSVTLTITDDDAAPTVTLALSRTSIPESGATNRTTVTARLDHPSSQPTTITVAAAPGTNAAAGDFSLSSNATLTIAAGATSSSGTVTVTSVDNMRDDPDKSVTVSGSATNLQGITQPASVTLTITDDDGEPTLSIDSPSVAEGDSGSASLTFTVSLDAASGKQVTVGYAEGAGGTATSGTDYTALSAGTLTFAAGDTSKTVTVSVRGDTTDEPNETVVVALSSPVNATVSATAGSGTGTITDDDDAPTVTLALSRTSIPESGATNSATVTARLDHPSSEDTTITVAAAAGANAASGDFMLSAGPTLTIAAGTTSSSGTVTVTSVDNTRDDPDKSVTVSGTATNSQGIMQPSSVTLTITDDDDAPTVTLALSRTSIPESGATNSTTVTAKLDHPSSQPTTITVAAAPGTNTASGDFTLSAGPTLTIAAGATSSTGSVTVTAVDNSTDEADKSVTVSGTATNGQGITQPSSVTLTITDDDAAPTVTLALSRTSIPESGATNRTTVTARLDHPSSQPTTITVAAAPGTNAAAGDFSLSSNATLTIAAGSTSSSGTVTVTAVDNMRDDPDKSVTVSGSATNLQGITQPASVTLTITDDDGEPTLSIDSPSVAEGDSGSASLTFTVSLDAASGKQVTVGYAEGAGGTATSGTDYTALSAGTLTFAAGDTSKTVTVSVRGDTTDEPNETVVVALSSPVNATVSATAGSGTGTITDDDDAPTVTLALSRTSIPESGATNRTTVTARLDHPSSEDTTITVAAAAGANAASGDFMLSAGPTLTIAAGTTSSSGTVTVTSVDNTRDDPDKSVTVSGTATNSQGITQPSSVTLTITDDDDVPTVTLALSRTSIPESGATNSATVTARLDHPSSQDTTITVSAAAGANTASGDFMLSAGPTLTIAAGATSSTGSVTVTAVDNTRDEANKSVTVSGSATNLQGITQPASLTLTITDDDGEPTLSIDSPSVAEGDSGSASLTFTVSLDAASGKQVTVGYAEGAGGTATSGTDYTALSAGTLTFAAGDTSKTVAVTVTGDTTDEPNETVVVTLSNPTNATVSATAGTGTGTITDDDATPTVTLVLSRTSIPESGATNNTTVTAKLDRPSSAATTITVAAAPGTNAAASDFTLSAGPTLTIAAGATSSTGSVTVTAVDNSTDEADKSVTVSGSATNSQGITQPSSVMLTITDDDGAPTLSIGSASVTEGNSGSASLTFTVSLDAASGKQVTVGYAEGAGGTATSGTDYTALSAGTLTFAAGDTSKTVVVSVRGDTTDEPNETVVVVLSSPTNAIVSATAGSGTGTITDDDDAPTVTLALSRSSIAESGATNRTTITARLDHPSSQPTTITVAAAPGTNAAASDFTLSAGPTLTIAAGATSSTGSVTVTAVDNMRDDPDKSVTVSGSATNLQGITQPASLTLTITDDDGEPTLSIDSPSVAEGDSGSASLTFTVSLDAASGKQVTVGYAEGAGGTATSGTDYTALSAGTLTFAAGDTSKTVVVSVRGDTTDEPNETVVVVLSSPTNAIVSATAGSGTGTITDDDDAPTVTLALSRSSIAESGATNRTTITARLDHPSSQPTTITVAAAPGTNAAASDFTLSAGPTLTIAAGATSSTGSVTVTAVDNMRDDPDKSVTVSGSATNLQGITQPASVTLTITDDDGEPTLSIDSPSVAEGDSGSASLTFTVSLDAASGKQVTVGYAEGAGGTATSGTDYTALSAGTLTFAAGDTSKTVAVSVRGDTTDEPNETVVVVLSSPTNAIVSATAGSGTGTITDDDDAPTVTLALSRSSIAESGATNRTTVTAKLDRPSSAATTITVAAAPGTNAAASDFTLSAGPTLTIAAGATSSTGSVTVTAVDNSTDEADKSVTVSGSATNSQGITQPSSVTLTITDDDGEPTLSIDSPSVAEGDSGSASLTFTVSLDAASGKQVTVSYAEGAGGTATSGTDYTALSAGTLTFAAGDTSKTVTVSVTGDTTDEPNETVVVALSGPTNATVSATASSGTGTITDDDATPKVTLALSRTSIPESGATNNTTVTAKLDRPSSAATTITVAAAPGTNAAASDFTLSAGPTLIIAAGATSSTGSVTVTAVDNSTDEADKSVTVSGTATNSQGITQPSSVALTITDDDGEPTLSIGSASVTEGNSGSANLTFTVSLDAASGKQVTVAYAEGAGGTATSGTDYTALSAGTLTFAAGDTSKTVAVSVRGDTTDEPNETVVVALSGPTNATVSATAGSGTGTITDDDATPKVTLALSRSSIAESGATNSTTVTARLDRPSSAATTITVAAAPGANAAAGDFTLNASPTLTIAAGATSSTGSVTVTAVDNSTDEADKSVTVSGTATNSQGITQPSNLTLTITDDDGEPTLSIGSASVTEGNSGSANLTFTVSLDAASGKQVTVAYAEGAGGTATSGTDYTALSAGTLTFAAGDTSKTVVVSVRGDTTDEPNETVVVVLSSPTNTIVSATAGSGTGTITDDDDAPTVTLALSRTSVPESGATNNTTVTAKLDHPSSEDTTITVSAAAGANAASGDFTLSAGPTLTIAAGTTSSSGTVTVTAVDNTRDDPDKSVPVSGSATNSQGITQPSSVMLTITDDDGVPTLSIGSASVTEGNSGSANLTFTVSLDAASGKQVTVGYAEGAGGTATSGTDYTALSAGTLTFAAGDTSKTVAVLVRGDTTDEPNETVVVTLSSPTNAAVSATAGSGTGTITDDDDAPKVTLALSRTSIPESGATNRTTVTARLDHPSSQPTTITVAAAPGRNAAAGDFSLSSNATLTIAAGSTSSSGTVTVTAVDNSRDDPDKSVTVSGSATNSQGITQPASLTLTITDDDGEPTLSIDSPSVAEGDSGSASLTFTVSLDAASGKQVTVGYAEGAGGTATSGTDYTALSAGTLTFAAGDTSKTVAVSVRGDTTDEPNETVVVVLSSPTNAIVSATAGSGTGTITDDDATPKVTLALSRTSIPESGSTSSATVTARLDHPSSQDTTITVAASAGANTASGDFRLSSNKTLTIAAGATSSSGTVTVTAVDNSTDEADKSVAVSGTATNSQGITQPSSVMLTITDDDGAPTLSIGSASVTEGNSGSASLTFTVSLDAASGKQVTVAYAEGAGGTATSGTDYTALSAGTLTFAAGDTSKTVTVSVTGDTTDEPNETVVVALSGPTNATVSATASSGTGTITDDDATPTVTLALSRTSIPESGATNSTTITAKLDRPSSAATTITVAAAPGTNAAASDFTLSAGPTLTIAAGATSSTGSVTVTAVDNMRDDPDKSVTVSGSATNLQGITQPASLTLTITDDDGEPEASIGSAPMTLSMADVEVKEGEAAAFLLSLSPPPPQPMMVRCVTAPVTATAGKDYEHVTGLRLAIAAGRGSVRVMVPTMDDRIPELDETFTLRIVPDWTAVEQVRATATIIDDDVSARARALEVTLASFGRTVASEAVNVIDERFADAQAGSSVTLGGHRLLLRGVSPGGRGGGRCPERREGGIRRAGPRGASPTTGGGRRRQSVGARGGDAECVLGVVRAIGRSRFRCVRRGMDGVGPDGGVRLLRPSRERPLGGRGRVQRLPRTRHLGRRRLHAGDGALAQRRGHALRAAGWPGRGGCGPDECAAVWALDAARRSERVGDDGRGMG